MTKEMSRVVCTLHIPGIFHMTGKKRVELQKATLKDDKTIRVPLSITRAFYVT